MWKDKIVEQVRKNREKLFAEFNYDFAKFSKYIMEIQFAEKKKLVTKQQVKKQVT